MKIYIGTDHAGYGLKEKLLLSLKGQEYEVIDKGAYEYNEHDDYPDFVIPVARAVSKDSNNAKGIIIGATGQGEAITANKFPNVRAVVYYGKSESVVDDEADVIIRSRQHNDANILSLGARYLTEEEMMNVVNLWLKTSYSGDERHVRRLGKIDQIHE
ncbi:ribose-5-phosphate isomerase [Candidatus Nomurabacteria bacterium RIFCSPHIGHO2_12_FULL_37_29]|uniref:Ribose-5-phosphate isomerase n=1 Tax=Candidatus Nomurabacteria bacterium RIFCSPHIGHO2_12_FULL_37_29 TaxID=1801759 RepID=A0A1F6WBV2_9BACT|nr:MAG: ribose-5-phosphate isomerase [Candidatus Nomurabacteria bacterium RIFCSPHIGHO2_01_FULL_37_110]OGI79369.1 MAG: ribose-5-phosphate isomerase [Candidatus Nomurabacteria bacterium RIFCSPHIGHO2_12_FULL_37_29]OGI84824.1 MAG: ribose-5-phosphate isomerase [Candidatus Nomurabacteria bacterium RIFCSPLOWO2_01_FULL_37_49]